MRNSIGSVTAILAVGAVGLLGAAHEAHAGCGSGPGTSAGTNPFLNGAFGLHAAALTSASSGGRFLTISDSNALPAAAIVGLWKFTFTVGTTVFDEGFVTWHADGTELMNSGKPPITSSFCMGAWEEYGPGKYSLNHWALSWDNTGTVFIGPTNIREKLVLVNANRYGGTFTIVQYATDGKTVLGNVAGNVTATRIEAD
jgi:hypothetical protein